MSKIAYQEINFRKSSLELIDMVNMIVNEYQAQGYTLTLRQVYYQLVSRDIIPNTERSYKNIGSLISNGRLAGLINWEAIEDRTREIRRNSHWDDVTDILRSAAYSFAVDKWQDQKYYLEVWVEKDALIGIVEQICSQWDITCFSCRGYVSQSEMWRAALRLKNQNNAVVLHLGDHDPSGKDMSRDIVDRLEVFGAYPHFQRIALNMDQIEQYDPPPNPAKLTDSRCGDYIAEYGYSSWELDALEPNVIVNLIESHIHNYLDIKKFRRWQQHEKNEQNTVVQIAERLGDIKNYLNID